MSHFRQILIKYIGGVISFCLFDRFFTHTHEWYSNSSMEMLQNIILIDKIDFY